MLGDYLYQLTSKDAQTQPVLQRKVEFLNVSTAAVAVNADATPIPGELMGLITHIGFGASGGGAQTINQFAIIIRDAQGNELMRVYESPNIVTAFSGGSLPGVQLLLFPGEFIRVTGIFSAGAVANGVRAGVSTLLMPKGNVQLR